VDYVTVANVLEAVGRLSQVGGSAYLTELIAETVSSVYAERHARIVRDYATRRGLLQVASDVAKLAWKLDEDIDTVQAQAQTALLQAKRETGISHRVSASQMASEVYDVIEQWQTKPLLPGQTRGLATGIRALDNALDGLESGVYIVAGRPSMGKTALLLQMVEGIAGTGHRCLLLSLEMSAQQVALRLATSLAQVDLSRLRQNRVDDGVYPPLFQALATINEWPLVVIDKPVIRPADVLAEASRLQLEHGDLAAIFVDGLWLMTPTKERENRTQTLGSISREVKRIQRELDVPVVLAHQLNRGLEQRGDKRPMLSDLRDTGDVEQDADVVLMLHRQGYYDPDDERANIAEVWVRKNRLGGQAGICAEMYWQGRYMRFLDLERNEPAF